VGNLGHNDRTPLPAGPIHKTELISAAPSNSGSDFGIAGTNSGRSNELAQLQSELLSLSIVCLSIAQMLEEEDSMANRMAGSDSDRNQASEPAPSNFSFARWNCKEQLSTPSKTGSSPSETTTPMACVFASSTLTETLISLASPTRVDTDTLRSHMTAIPVACTCKHLGGGACIIQDLQMVDSNASALTT